MPDNREEGQMYPDILVRVGMDCRGGVWKAMACLTAEVMYDQLGVIDCMRRQRRFSVSSDEREYGPGG
jgi:hypothetical protein